MPSAVLNQIEKTVSHLSRKEQLWLIEQLAHRLREDSPLKQTILEKQLAAMAADPEIQAELRRIEQEFAVTEANGLEGQ